MNRISSPSVRIWVVRMAMLAATGCSGSGSGGMAADPGRDAGLVEDTGPETSNGHDGGAADAIGDAGNSLGCIGTFELLQQTLQSGKDAVLCPKATITLSRAVSFHAHNQQIYTAGFPEDDLRATLVLGSEEVRAAIRMEGQGFNGVKVRNIQINGMRSKYPYMPCTDASGRAQDCPPPVVLKGSRDITVDHVRIFNSRGWSHLYVGRIDDCSNATITNNQIGPGGSDEGELTDGLSIPCPNSLIQGNTITDVTDGGIVLFGAKGTRVIGNTIISREQTLALGMGLTDCPGQTACGDLTGVVVDGNQILEHGNDKLIHVGIAAGTHTWFGDIKDLEIKVGNQGVDLKTFGATITGNTIKISGFAIPVSGVRDFAITQSSGEVFYDASSSENVVFSAPPQIVEDGALDYVIYRSIFIYRSYRELLGRKPDAPGHHFWVLYLGKSCNGATLKSVTREIATGAEGERYLGTRTPEQIISSLHRVILRREPEASELLSGQDVLIQHPSPPDGINQLIDDLYSSPEYNGTATTPPTLSIAQRICKIIDP